MLAHQLPVALSKPGLRWCAGIEEPPTVSIFRGGTKMAEFASAKGQPVPTETFVSSISELAGLDAAASLADDDFERVARIAG